MHIPPPSTYPIDFFPMGLRIGVHARCGKIWWVWHRMFRRVSNNLLIETPIPGDRHCHSTQLAHKNLSVANLCCIAFLVQVAWYENQGGSFSTRRTLYDRAGGIQAIATGDINRDGSVDTVYCTSWNIGWIRTEQKDDGNLLFSEQTLEDYSGILDVPCRSVGVSYEDGSLRKEQGARGRGSGKSRSGRIVLIS